MAPLSRWSKKLPLKKFSKKIGAGESVEKQVHQCQNRACVCVTFGANKENGKRNALKCARKLIGKVQVLTQTRKQHTRTPIHTKNTHRHINAEVRVSRLVL